MHTFATPNSKGTEFVALVAVSAGSRISLAACTRFQDIESKVLLPSHSSYLVFAAHTTALVTMQAVNPAEMLTIYGLTLMVVGALAFQAAPQDAKAMSSIYMGNGGALISFLLAVGARDTTVEKGQPGYIPMMICVHLAFIFPMIYGSAVGWRLALAWDVPAKAYLRPYFITIVAMSILTALVVYRAKPKKPQNPSHDAAQEKDSNTQEVQHDQTAQETPQTETIRRRRRGTAM